MGIIEVWTLIAVVLHCCDVKYFANLPIIDWPWNWSCLCLEIWLCFVYIALGVLWVYLHVRQRKHEIESMKCKIEILEREGHTTEAMMLRRALNLGGPGKIIPPVPKD